MPITRIQPSLTVVIASCVLLLGGITACSSSSSTVVEQKTEINPTGSTSANANAQAAPQSGSIAAATASSSTSGTGQGLTAIPPEAAAPLAAVTREKLVDMSAAIDLSKGSGTVTVK